MSAEVLSSLESRVEGLLCDPAASNADLHTALAELSDHCRMQQQMLNRLIHISDKYQLAERERGRLNSEQLLRKVRQVEKIVRISDGYQSMLQDLHARLTAISNHDDLTGLANRRYMQDRLKQTIAQSGRTGDAFSVAMVDIDFFKKINDSAGHAVGDVVLKRVSECLRQGMRDYDLCARWGGEEFLTLFPGCQLQQTAPMAERLRIAVAAIATDDLHAGLHLSVSIGYTEFHPGEGVDHMIKRADEALYRAKAAGRNCVVGDESNPRLTSRRP